jgi:L-proline amide hydrolase
MTDGADTKTREGFAPYRGYQTWYRITGNLSADQPPLIIVHGGPGCTHDYVDSFKDLAGDRRHSL